MGSQGQAYPFHLSKLLLELFIHAPNKFDADISLPFRILFRCHENAISYRTE